MAQTFGEILEVQLRTELIPKLHSGEAVGQTESFGERVAKHSKALREHAVKDVEGPAFTPTNLANANALFFVHVPTERFPCSLDRRTDVL